MDKVSQTLPPLPSLDHFTTLVATTENEQWLPHFTQHAAHLLNASDIGVFLRHGNDLHLLHAQGNAPALSMTDLDARFPRQNGDTLLIGFPGLPDAALWARTATDAEVAQEQLSGWLGAASLGLKWQQVSQEAERQRSARDHFFSMVNHDLKGPLSSIKAMSDLIHRKLQRGTLDPGTPEGREDLLERLGFMSQRVRDLAALIDEIGEISYIERGRLQLNRQRVNVSSVLRGSVEGIQAQSNRAIQFEEGESSFYVRGDNRRLAQIFDTVLKNAVTYTTPDTPIVVRLTSPDETVQIEIEDKGPGIDEAIQPHLFHEYGRAVQKGSTGLGAGLFIANALVMAHGGTLVLESAANSGTTVRIIFPCLPEQSDG